MSFEVRPLRRRSKPRPRSRPRLVMPSSPTSPIIPTNPSPLFPPSASASVVKAEWSADHVMLEQLLQHHALPQLVQCRTPVLKVKDGGSLPFRLDRPILLAEQRTARHLLARIVVHDPQQGTFNESVDSVVIPEDYEGHFLRLHSRTTKDTSHVQSLQSVSHDDTPAFLNLSDITSFPAARHPKDSSHFIYTVGNVFLVDEPVAPAASAVSNDKTKGTKPDAKDGQNGNGLMRCLDERGMVVMVPTNQAGQVVSVQKQGDNRPKLSVKSSEMIASQQFPLLTRFAYGKSRPRLAACTKLFTLLDSFQETSVVGCVLDGPSLMLLEIPLSSTLQFQRATNRDQLLHTPRMRNALHACRTRGHELSRDMKFKFKFSHRVQETSKGRMAMKDDELPSATIRTRLLVTETYIYI